MFNFIIDITKMPPIYWFLGINVTFNSYRKNMRLEVL